jgi:threonylcarbamoyladenosine tRNA methylthiotransferase MtaB
MRRRYTQGEYRDAVLRLRQAIPGVAITTDVIAGFADETEEEFEESYDFCREMAFAAIHVFPYSQRPGTLAFKLPNQVPDAIKKARVHRLIELSKQTSSAFRERYAGTAVDVLWETRRDGVWEGLTDTYVRVRTRSEADLTNSISTAWITEANDDGLLAEVHP